MWTSRWSLDSGVEERARVALMYRGVLCVGAICVWYSQA